MRVLLRVQLRRCRREQLLSQGRAWRSHGEDLALVDRGSDHLQMQERSCRQAANQANALAQLVK